MGTAQEDKLQTDHLLSVFRKIVVDQFDKAIHDIEVYENTPNCDDICNLLDVSHSLRKLDQCQRFVVQLILEDFIHGLFYRLDCNSEIQISGRTAGNTLVDIKSLTNVGLYGDVLDWLAESSENGSATLSLVAHQFEHK